MSDKTVHMKPIWYFVGLMLLSMGGIILLTGLYLYFFGIDYRTVFAALHPNLWWGTVMIVAGALFLLLNRHASE